MLRTADPKTAMPYRRGFTLTELAIVLGIIGLILGAIWAAASKVYANNKVNQATQEILTLANGVRSLYGSKGKLDAGDLTSIALNNNLYPPSMIQQNCNGLPSYGAAISPCPVHPWIGEMSIGSQTTGQALAGPTNMFEIVLWTNGSSKAWCSALMAAIVTRASTSDLNAIYSDGASSETITSASSPTDNVIINCNGNVDFQFKL